MNITVFGGGGFIGSHICDLLIQKGYFVRIFEKPGVLKYRSFQVNEKIEWMTGDLLNKKDICLALENTDVVIHLVSTTLPKNSNDDPIYDVQTNVVSSINILDSMVKNNIKKIIFISSGGTVYGTPKYLPINEQHQTNPEVSYGITKLTIEKYMILYKRLHDIKPVILRVSNPFGERQRVDTSQGAIGIFVTKALKGLPVEIWGDGSITRDYIYVSDVADAFLRAIHYNGCYDVFNIGTAKGVSLNDILDRIEKIEKIKIKRNYLPVRKFDVNVNILCNYLASKELAWSPIKDFDSGLEKTINWIKNNIKD